MTDPFAIAWVLTLTCWLTLEVLHHIERKDMYNRLMSKDFADYQQTQTAPPKGKPNHLEKSIKQAYRNQRNEDDY